MNFRNLKNIRYRFAKKYGKLLLSYAQKLEFRKTELELMTWNKKFIDKPFFTHTLKEGLKINLYKDSILSKVIYDGFEQQELDFMKKTLKAGDIFLDIGSNIGLFSLIASGIIKDEGKIIAFEPFPLIRKRFEENVTLNGFKNIEIRELGLSNTTGNLDFFISENGHDAWNSLANSQDSKLSKKIVITVSTLDKELENIQKEKIKLVKVDVEGWEKFTLLGGSSFFENFSPIVMIEFTEDNTKNAGYNIMELFGIMKNMGYQWFELENNVLIPHKIRSSYPYCNLFAVKPS